MIELVILMAMIIVSAPLVATLVFALWSMRSMELDREPTKEEWKAGKRRKEWF